MEAEFENGCLEMFPLLYDFVAEKYVTPQKTLVFQRVLNAFVKNAKMQDLPVSLQK